VPGVVTGNQQYQGLGVSRSCDRCLVHHNYYSGKWHSQPRRWLCAGCSAKIEAAKAAKAAKEQKS
jgi:hypothetical protein